MAKNPLDAFVTPGVGPNTLRVPAVPNLSQLVQNQGLGRGIVAFDEAMEDWRQNLEKSINEQFQKLATISPGPIT